MSGSAVSSVAGPARRRDPRRLVVDVVVVLVVATLLGLLAGFLVARLADPVTVTRTANGLARDEVALSHQFSALGWFSVLSAVGGLLLGAVMLAWRRTDEVVTLLAVVVGALLAAWFASELALTLGHEDPARALADAADGETATAALTLGGDPRSPDPDRPSGIVYWVWPLFAVLGALLYLISPLSERPLEEAVASEGPGVATANGSGSAVDVSGTVTETPPSRP